MHLLSSTICRKREGERGSIREEGWFFLLVGCLPAIVEPMCVR
jgi:hypothetical protein